jgi:hypothetical protein
MKKLVGKFGKYNVATFIIMGVGLITFLLTPLLLYLWDFDSDMLGALIFLTGLVMYLSRRLIKKVRSNKQVN